MSCSIITNARIHETKRKKSLRVSEIILKVATLKGNCFEYEKKQIAIDMKSAMRRELGNTFLTLESMSIRKC